MLVEDVTRELVWLSDDNGRGAMVPRIKVSLSVVGTMGSIFWERHIFIENMSEFLEARNSLHSSLSKFSLESF